MNSLLRVFVAVSTIAVAAGCQGKQAETPGASGSEKASQGTTAKAGGASASEHQAAPSAGESRAGQRLSLRAGDDGRDLDLRVGQVVTIVLDSNHASGLNWLMVDPPGTVVVLMGNPLYAPGKGMSGGTETWRFRAARAGRQTVRLEYGRPQGRNVPERAFRFNATVR